MGTAQVTAADRRRVRAGRIAGAATLIAGLTVLSRVAGFGRTMVFAWAVGDNDLGDIYQAANIIPNIVFEIVAGGALASLVVPMLAGAIAAGDRAEVGRITSALLCWVLTLLAPLALGLVLAAEPMMAALLTDPTPAQVAGAAAMLRIFAPQVPLYGVGIVLTGVLQAHRRFAWPVLAPLLSSITVSSAYVGLVAVDGRGVAVAELSGAGMWTLAGGTTVGVVVLAGCLVPVVARLRLRLRPTWRFDAATRSRVGQLATAGAITVGAQHVALAVAVWRGNAGPEGTWVLFTLAQAIFLLPWAVFAVPLATAANPGLAEAAAVGNETDYRHTLARTTRMVLLLSWLGAAALVAVARPAASLLAVLMPAGGVDSVDRLAAGIAGFAPGLVGYGLFAVLSRALYARGRTRAVSVAALLGWGTAAVAMLGLSPALPDDHRVLALTGAHSLGMLVLGVLLWWATARAAGPAAVAGGIRVTLVGLMAATVAAVAGWWVAGWLLPFGHPPTFGAAIGSGMLAGVTVLTGFGVLAWVTDRRDVQPALVALGRRLRRRAATGASGD